VPPTGEHPDQTETGSHLPDPACALAKISHRQTNELVTARFELHRPQQILGFLLELAAPG
jgi:hypothetical protein